MKRGAPVLILLALCLPLLGSGKRSDGVLVSFHAEGKKEEWPKFAQAVKMSDGKQYYFRIMPVVTDANVAWYYPFIAPDKTFGVAFKLDSRGTNALTTYTSSPENHGQLLAAVVHPISQQTGGVRSYLQIDKRVTDGIIVIWSGLTDKHLRVFSARYPHVRDLMGDADQQIWRQKIAISDRATVWVGMTDTTKTDSIFSRQTRPSQGAQAVAISTKEYGYIRLLAAISGEPEEVLLADFLANKAERRQF